jgi:hypothetical protein
LFLDCFCYSIDVPFLYFQISSTRSAGLGAWLATDRLNPELDEQHAHVQYLATCSSRRARSNPALRLCSAVRDRHGDVKRPGARFVSRLIYENQIFKKIRWYLKKCFDGSSDQMRDGTGAHESMFRKRNETANSSIPTHGLRLICSLCLQKKVLIAISWIRSIRRQAQLVEEKWIVLVLLQHISLPGVNQGNRAEDYLGGSTMKMSRCSSVSPNPRRLQYQTDSERTERRDGNE